VTASSGPAIGEGPGDDRDRGSRGPPPSEPELLTDYAPFAFEDLWRGRDRVTLVERALLARAMEGADLRRLLEIGTGFGRLLPDLRARSIEMVALDMDRDRLASLSPSLARGREFIRVAANLYHLPFSDRSFSAVTLIRVHHHLARPGEALAEIARVLAPGGTALVSYTPHPSLGTLFHDVSGALRRRGAPRPWTTFAGPRTVALPPEPFPLFVGTRSTFRADAAAAGLTVVREFVSGLEEFAGVRRLPVRTFVGLGVSLGSVPGFPMRLSVLRRAGHADGPLPEIMSSWVCPRCRAPLALDGAPDTAIRCGGCGERYGFSAGVYDLRYAPPGALRLGPR
jgi:SAM-dependent methyltransferase/DNA-directed RNA polymerase subunit RPC12/RpoP